MKLTKFKTIATLAAMFVVPQAALAENNGIEFAKMPVGTKMTYKRSDGLVFTDTFVGKRGRFYVVNRAGKTNAGKTYWEKRRYDKEGRLTSYSWGDNRGAQPGKIFYKPYDCQYVVGECTMRRKLVAHDYVNNGAGYTAKYSTKKQNGGFTTTFKQSNRKSSSSYSFTTGKYNLRTSTTFGTRGSWSLKLVKIH